MLFNSYPFIFVFLPVVLIGFFWVARSSHRLAALWLVAASVFFYGWWNPKFVFLLLASIAFNYCMGLAIGRARTVGGNKARILLTLAVGANLVVLGIFKYTNFFIKTFDTVAGAQVALVDIILPLGISFFTFTQITFLVDVYRGIARDYLFVHYLLFVTYFPHLIAGPILHHQQMIPQFEKPATYSINPEHVAIGLSMFAIGLAKKVLLADNFSDCSAGVFAAASRGEELQFIEAWSGVLSYSLQLYFDFSGYSDMAIGLSKMFGVDLPINFNSPYKATNIIEFWRRWHITLSQFLRDYLYFPLGGNRRGGVRRYANLMVTMLLGGLWHGANWTFVIWGGIHGALLMINHGWVAMRQWFRPGGARAPSMLGRVVGTALTFLAVTLAWLFFRATDVSAALALAKAMAFGNGLSLPEALAALVGHVGFAVQANGFFPVTGVQGRWALPLVALGLFIVFFLPNSQELLFRPPAFPRVNLLTPTTTSTGTAAWSLGTKAGAFVAALLAGSLLSLSAGSEFLYFQF